MDVPRVPECGADLVRFRTFSFDRIRNVRLDGFLEFPPDDVPAYDVCDRSNRAEPLDSEEIGEAPERTDLAGGLFGDVQHSLRALVSQFVFPFPQVDQASMKLRVRDARRVVQPLRQVDRVVGSIAGAVWEAEHPQHQRRRGEAHHPGVVTELEASWGVPLGIVRRNSLLQMLHARLEPTEQGQIGAQHQVPFDPSACIVVALGEAQDLLS